MELNEKPITLNQFCELTGLARNTVYSLQYKGELKDIAHRFGPRLLRFYPSEVLAWMENRNKTFRPMKEVMAERKAAS